MPLFPFHTWLPDAHVQAPTAGSVILAGVLLKMGTYGLVRFAFPLFPEAATAFAPYLAFLAVVGIIYGALVAMVQPDMKKLVAYSSVSHLGFVVLGIAAMNTQGVQGAVYQMLNHGVSTGGLFLIVGMLSDRRHTRLISEFGGLKKVTPRLVAAFMIITLSSIGLPGLNGFVGEFLILLGAFRSNPRMAAFAATGVVLSATYMLWMFQRVNYGPVSNEKNAGAARSTPREWVVLVAPIVAMRPSSWACLPNLFLTPIEPSVARIAESDPAKSGSCHAYPGARFRTWGRTRALDRLGAAPGGVEGSRMTCPSTHWCPLPVLVAAAGIAAMLAEAFRDSNERMAIGPLGADRPCRAQAVRDPVAVGPSHIELRPRGRGQFRSVRHRYPGHRRSCCRWRSLGRPSSGKDFRTGEYYALHAVRHRPA